MSENLLKIQAARKALEAADIQAIKSAREATQPSNTTKSKLR